MDKFLKINKQGGGGGVEIHVISRGVGVDKYLKINKQGGGTT